MKSRITLRITVDGDVTTAAHYANAAALAMRHGNQMPYANGVQVEVLAVRVAPEVKDVTP